METAINSLHFNTMLTHNPMNTFTRPVNFKKLIGSIALCELIGIVAGLFTINAIKEWYVYLNKPEFNPPNWIFGPVWTLLYLLMGIAFYNTLKSNIKDSNYHSSISLFWVQLTLNFLWTIAFFGMRNPTFAFAIIITLIASICVWTLYLQKVHRASAYLQIPYLLWCCFACVLNYYIIRLN